MNENIQVLREGLQNGMRRGTRSFQVSRETGAKVESGRVKGHLIFSYDLFTL